MSTVEPTRTNATKLTNINSRDLYQTNKLIIKSNSSAVSMYDLKRPQIIKSNTNKPVRKHRRNVAN